MKAHPLAELIPPMTDVEYRELVNDIEANGLREAVTTYEGKILDGRHRARACEQLGRSFETRTYDGSEPVVYVVSMNVHRRHLTTAQRAELARRLMPELQKQAKERQREHGGTAPGRPNTSGNSAGSEARDQAGALAGVSGATVGELVRLAEDDPDLHEQVVAGEKKVSEARKEAFARKIRPPKLAAPQNKRQEDRAQAAKTRIEKVLGTCQALSRAHEELNFPLAVSVSSLDEVEAWEEVFKQTRSGIGRLRRNLKEAVDAT